MCSQAILVDASGQEGAAMVDEYFDSDRGCVRITCLQESLE